MIKSAGKKLADLVGKAGKQGTTAYDTTAQVVRTEGDTLWVHIPGGVDETPVRKTVAAIPGDTVQVRVSGGRAWITGNRTAPPTDDRVANEAQLAAHSANGRALTALDESLLARLKAEGAVDDAQIANLAATSAVQSASVAQQAANTAQNAALAAQTRADEAYQSAYEASVASDTASALATQAQTSADNALSEAGRAAELANEAQLSANVAKESADDAIADAATAHDQALAAVESATTAQESAVQAQRSAADARSRADEAYSSAITANTAASGAIESLSIVEDVLGVLNWVSTHATYKLTTDITPVPSKYYFVKNGNEYQFVLPDSTTNPEALGYYEIDDIQEAVSNYVATHLALVDNGLLIQATGNSSTSRMLVSPTEGVVLYGPDGSPVATYGQSTIIGNTNSFNIRISSSSTTGEVGFYEGSTRVAYINNQSLYITQSVVLDEMKLGQDKWVWKYDSRDDSIILKWIGA